MCLLHNDFRLHRLGYTTTPGEWARAAIEVAKRKTDNQLELF